MITGAQMRAARALLGLDQRGLARLSGLSLPTIQRMESSEGSVRAVVDSLEKVVDALAEAGVELIAEGAPSVGTGRGVRLLERSQKRVSPMQRSSPRRANVVSASERSRDAARRDPDPAAATRRA